MTNSNPVSQTTTKAVLLKRGHRSWWGRVYKAGIKADLDEQPRIPPEELPADQKVVWLAGYDR